jgi:hypothetical protein
MEIFNIIDNVDNKKKLLLKDGFNCSYELFKLLFENNNLIPDNIIKIIYNNKLNLIKDLYNLCIKYYDKNKNISDIKLKLLNKNNNEKEMIIQILEWFENIKLFNVNNNKFKYRINQEYSINRLNNKGLQTGIECQATGVGKTYIILYYLNYMIDKYSYPKIILFTERVNIFNDLFDFNIYWDKKNKIYNNSKILEWKKSGICDLTKYNIYNLVTDKIKDWYNFLNKENKNCIIVINRAFLTKNELYKNINNLDLILHDECHNATSKQCYNFLKYFKNKGTKIVGFSATPLRTGNNQLNKLSEIYNNDIDNKINLLSDFSFIKAIENNLIVEPIFNWFPFNNINKDEIDDIDIKTILSCLEEKLIDCKYKKIIAWCRYIHITTLWIEKLYQSINKYNELKNLRFYIDTNYNGKYNFGSYDDFKKIDSNGIMFCAQKHREGSDIKNLDACIFLDKVKSRTPLLFIQSIGRVLRKNEDKNFGYIFDGIQIDNYDLMINKIFEYYEALQNISNIDNLSTEDYNNRLDNIYNNIKYDNDILTLKIGNKDIKINTKKINFNNSTFNKLKTHIKQKKKEINNDFLKNDFRFSKIINCIINDKVLNVHNYKPIIIYIYNQIEDKNFIIKNTVLNIIEGNFNDKGFNFFPKHNISVQGADAIKTIKEIINMCSVCNFKLELEIKLKNENIIKFKNY